MGFAALGELLAQGLDEPRLPDAGLAHDQHGLTVALACGLEARAQQTPLVIPAHEGAEAARCGRGQATSGAARSDDPQQLERLGHAAQASRAERLHREQTCYEAVGGGRGEHAAGTRLPLHARREVRCLSEREHLTGTGATADFTHDHGPGVDPDAHREPLSCCERVLETRNGVDQLEPRAHGALGIVAMRRRPAEVGEQTVAEVLCDVAAVARDHGLGRTLIAAEHLAPVLGIEPHRDLGGAHEVAEEHRELAPPGRFGRGRGGCGVRERSAARAAEAPERANRCPADAAGTRELPAAALAEAGLGAVLVAAGGATHRLGRLGPMLSRGARAAPSPATAPRSTPHASASGLPRRHSQRCHRVESAAPGRRREVS